MKLAKFTVSIFIASAFLFSCKKETEIKAPFENQSRSNNEIVDEAIVRGGRLVFATEDALNEAILRLRSEEIEPAVYESSKPLFESYRKHMEESKLPNQLGDVLGTLVNEDRLIQVGSTIFKLTEDGAYALDAAYEATELSNLISGVENQFVRQCSDITALLDGILGTNASAALRSCDETNRSSQHIPMLVSGEIIENGFHFRAVMSFKYQNYLYGLKELTAYAEVQYRTTSGWVKCQQNGIRPTNFVIEIFDMYASWKPRCRDENFFGLSNYQSTQKVEYSKVFHSSARGLHRFRVQAKVGLSISGVHTESNYYVWCVNNFCN
jgi:hypothetical protein